MNLVIERFDADIRSTQDKIDRLTSKAAIVPVDPLANLMLRAEIEDLRLQLVQLKSEREGVQLKHLTDVQLLKAEQKLSEAKKEIDIVRNAIAIGHRKLSELKAEVKKRMRISDQIIRELGG